MTRDDALKLLHAYVDGELDAAKTLELDAHLAEDASTRAACEALRGMSAAIRGKADYHVAPGAFAQRLADAVPPSAGGGPRRFGLLRWLPAAGAVACAVALAWVIAIAAMR